MAGDGEFTGGSYALCRRTSRQDRVLVDDAGTVLGRATIARFTGVLTVLTGTGPLRTRAFRAGSALRAANGTIVVGGNTGWRLPDGRRLDLVEDGKTRRAGREPRTPTWRFRDETGRTVMTLSWVGPRDKPLDIGRADLAPSLTAGPELVPFLAYAFHRFARNRTESVASRTSQ